MKVIVRGKNKFKPTEAIRNYVTNKLQKIEQYFSKKHELEANVLCKVYEDVYKRQVDDLPVIVLRLFDMPGLVVEPSQGVTSVSYTHLDVYKRQSSISALSCCRNWVTAREYP